MCKLKEELDMTKELTEYEQKNRESFIRGLRYLLTTLEEHPDLPAPYLGAAVQRCESRGEMRELVKAYAGKWDKEDDPTDFQIRQKFGDSLSIILYASHEKVCKRVVTGKKVVPAQVIPAQPEQVLPEREVDIVQWVCPGILNGDANES
jgi:hypothetical protein